jgi:hypothetical protein
MLRIEGNPANKVCRADIIKIEHPTRGDDTRSWGPPDAPYIDGVERQFPGESAYYLSVCFIFPQKHVFLTKFRLTGTRGL